MTTNAVTFPIFSALKLHVHGVLNMFTHDIDDLVRRLRLIESNDSTIVGNTDQDGAADTVGECGDSLSESAASVGNVEGLLVLKADVFASVRKCATRATMGPTNSGCGSLTFQPVRSTMSPAASESSAQSAAGTWPAWILASPGPSTCCAALPAHIVNRFAPGDLQPASGQPGRAYLRRSGWRLHPLRPSPR